MTIVKIDYPPCGMSRIEQLALRVCALKSCDAPLAREERERLEGVFLDMARDYSALITRLCYHYTTPRTPLEDLRQDCLINLWRGLRNYRGECGMATWVYRVVINTCITSFRSAGRQPEFIALENHKETAEEEEPISENMELLHAFISGLPLLDRGVMMMWLDGRTYDEIAEATGLTRNNVAVKLHRIKEKIKTGMK